MLCFAMDAASCDVVLCDGVLCNVVFSDAVLCDVVLCNPVLRDAVGCRCFSGCAREKEAIQFRQIDLYERLNLVQ